MYRLAIHSRTVHISTPWGLAGAFTVLYAVLSLLRSEHLGTAGYDLGIFTEAVKSYAHFAAPYVSIKGPHANLLGDHFSPVFALLAPAWWIWPSPDTLLVAQACLMGVSAVPICRLARSRFGTAGAISITIAYGVSWGIQGAVAFDVHEVAFAVPLLAFGLEALDEGAWTRATWLTCLLVLVKEDLGLTVAAIGVVMLIRGQRRRGMYILAFGVSSFAVETLVLIPKLDNLFHTYRYWGIVTHGAPNTGGRPSISSLLSLIAHFPSVAFSSSGKPELIFWAFGATAFLALRSPIAIATVPTFAWRLDASNSQYWNVGPLHYNAILMPIVFIAMLDAARKPANSAAVQAILRFAPMLVLTISVLALPKLSLWSLTKPATYQRDSHAAAARALAELIPSGAQVATSNNLAPLLVSRCDVWLFPDPWPRRAAFVLIDTANLGSVPQPPAEQSKAIEALPASGYRLEKTVDHIRLYERRV